MDELRLGVSYCRQNRAVGVMIFLVSMVGFFVMHASLLPAIAKDVLRGDASTYGLISTAPGIGTVIAAVVTTNITTQRTLLRAAALCAACVPLTTLAIGGSKSVLAAVLALSAFGIAWMTFTTLISTMVITVTDDAYRGRVMGLMSMASIGVFPVNAVIAGVMADWLGAGTTILVTGCCLALALAAFFGLGYMRVIADGVRGWQHGPDEPALST